MSNPVPAGERIASRDTPGPDRPIIPFIGATGRGATSGGRRRRCSTAVAKAYGGKRAWPGWRSSPARGLQADQNWLPTTIEAFGPTWWASRGPLTTPVGGGIRA